MQHGRSGIATGRYLRQQSRPRLVPSESHVQGLVRPVYKDDGNSSSRGAVVVQASPAGGVLPIWRRPVWGRHQTGSG
jgi:hypothetical protein